MNLISWVRQFFTWLWTNKSGLLIGLLSAVVFAFFIFPYDDLTDLISAQVSLRTRNQIYVEFERLKMSLFPQAGVQMDRVYLEAVNLPGLSAQSITITPAIAALFAQKPYGHVSAKGLLHGDVDVKVSGGTASEKGTEITGLDIQAQHLSLQDIRSLAKLPVLLKGQLDLKTAGQLDLAFAEQPDMELNLKINKFEMPPSNVPTPLGDITLPELKLSDLEVKGKLSAGRLLIENGRIGSAGDDLQGNVKGTIAMNVRNTPMGLVPEFGSYSLEIDLLPSPGFKSRAAFLLEILSAYKTGDHIKFKASGSSFGLPPTMLPIR